MVATVGSPAARPASHSSRNQVSRVASAAARACWAALESSTSTVSVRDSMKASISAPRASSASIPSAGSRARCASRHSSFDRVIV